MSENEHKNSLKIVDYQDFHPSPVIATTKAIDGKAFHLQSEGYNLYHALHEYDKLSAILQTLDEIENENSKDGKKIRKAIGKIFAGYELKRYVINDYDQSSFYSMRNIFLSDILEKYNNPSVEPHSKKIGLAQRLSQKFFSKEDILNKFIENQQEDNRNVLGAFLLDLKNNMGKKFPHKLQDILDEEERGLDGYRSKLRQILDALEEKGIKRISSNLRGGGFALVLEMNDNQMIRIVTSETKKLQSLPPTVLQPLYTIDNVEGFCIQIMPKVYVLEELFNPDNKLKAEYGLLDEY